VFCTQCGQQNPADARFCARCGTALAPGGESGGSSADTTSALSAAALERALAGEATGATPEPAGHAPEQAHADGLPSGTGLLVVKRGPNAGSRFLLDADVTTAGRHPDSDIFLDDITVSRRHAEFVREEGGFALRDVGSLNGTYLNRERIEHAVLAGGDEVQIGKYRLVFLAGAGEA
jgi:pSer/pThr/pTyr-binding forkhead associated (FHA) protein